MSLLQVHNSVEGVETLVSSAISVVKMAPPDISSTLPAGEVAETATSNATAVGATSNVGAAHGISSTIAIVASTAGGIALIGCLLAFALIPVENPGNVNEPIPFLSDPDITLSKVPCPDSGSAMFTGYKISSNTSENGQLLMVALVELPENLELFLINSFELPTASNDFFGNQTAPAQV
jgi:hypothetical protein